MTMRRIVLALLAILWLFAAARRASDAQCAMCRTALESSEQGQAIAEKFNKGILFLLGAPFSVAAGIGVAMLRSRRRLR